MKIERRAIVCAGMDCVVDFVLFGVVANLRAKRRAIAGLHFVNGCAEVVKLSVCCDHDDDFLSVRLRYFPFDGYILPHNLNKCNT